MQKALHPVVNEEIDLRSLLATLWKGRWLIIVTTSLCALGSVAYALLATPWFESTVVMVPADTKSLSGGLGQLSGLASLAGVNLGAVGSSQTPIAVLRSREFARKFIEDESLLTVLLADKWDAVQGKWRSADPEKQPDIRDAVKYFDEKVRAVAEDKKNGLVMLSVTWKDAATSAAWANALVSRINDDLRGQALAEAERNIKYLQGEMAGNSITSLQQSVGRVLESEMQKALLARGSAEYAFKVVDAAVAPRKPVRPQRALLLVGGLLGGLFLSMFFVLARHALLTPKTPGA